jgi:predicted RNase H-like HicB family nuclease
MMTVNYRQCDHGVQPMRIELHVRKHRDSDWLQVVTADWYRKRDDPWDAANPDLRGFNIQRPSEEALLASLPAALKTFLEHLGFDVKGDIVVARDRDADIANLWPALYVAEVPASRPANDARRVSTSFREHTA